MMACSMSSAGLWPTLARRSASSTYRCFHRTIGLRVPSGTFPHPKQPRATGPQAPLPAKHTIPFHVWSRFPQAADSATDWQALLRCQCSGDDGLPVAVPAEQHCSALRRRCEVLGTSESPTAAGESGCHSEFKSGSRSSHGSSSAGSRTRTRIFRLLWATGGRKGSQPAGGPAAGRSLAAVMAVPGRTSAWARLTDLRAVTVQLPVLP